MLDITEKQISNRYLKLAQTATDEQHRQARKWYLEAEKVAICCAIESGYSLECCAGIIAAFSPLQKWNINIRQSIRFCRTGTIKTMGNNRKNARNVIETGFSALQSPKIHNFARAIAGDESACVIDRWMIRAAGCKKDKITNLEYEQIAAGLRKAAVKFGLPVRTFQALVWIVIRGRK